MSKNHFNNSLKTLAEKTNQSHYKNKIFDFWGLFNRNRITLQFLNISIIYLSFENNLYNFCDSQYLDKVFKINKNNIYNDVIIYWILSGVKLGI